MSRRGSGILCVPSADGRTGAGKSLRRNDMDVPLPGGMSGSIAPASWPGYEWFDPSLCQPGVACGRPGTTEVARHGDGSKLATQFMLLHGSRVGEAPGRRAAHVRASGLPNPSFPKVGGCVEASGTLTDRLARGIRITHRAHARGHLAQCPPRAHMHCSTIVHRAGHNSRGKS